MNIVKSKVKERTKKNSKVIKIPYGIEPIQHYTYFILYDIIVLYMLVMLLTAKIG